MTRKPDFAAFHRACTGHDPFPWQQEAASAMSRGEPPEVVAVPTGLGKTGLVVAWAWALACCESGKEGRKAPLRLVHVSPRRTIVDQTSALMERIACVLEDPARVGDAEAEAAARWAAGRLLRFTGGEGKPLVSARLRGGIRPDPTWRGRVDQPVAIAATSDLAGSGLLFRHWTSSASVWPITAALLGVDCCWVLDEAHLQAPLRTTLARCREAERGSPLRLPWWLVETTATPAAAGSGHLLGISEEDRRHQVAKQRMEVKRQIHLHGVEKNGDVVDALVQRSTAAADKKARAVLVVVDTVEHARAVRAKLDKKAAGGKGRVLLLHGQQRERDRQAVLSKALPFFGMDRRPPEDGPACVLVATNAIEVGADLSADHLVTVACPGDSLLQRLGRLGRRATQDTYDCDVVYVSGTGNKATLHVEASSKTVHYLEEKGATSALGVTVADPKGLDSPELAAPRPEPMALSAADLQSLVRTRPAPVGSPDVDALVHGLDDHDASAYLAWRDDLVEDDPASWPGALESWPIRPHELLSLPVWELHQWLLDKEKVQRPFLLWVEGRRGRLVAAGEKGRGPLRPGAIVVVPSSYGGHDGYGFAPKAAAPAEDLADLVTEHPKGPRLRLRPDRMPAELSERLEAVVELAKDLDAPDSEVDRVILELLRDLADDEGAAPVARDAARALVVVADGAASPRRGAPLEWELRLGRDGRPCGLAVRVAKRFLDDDEDDLCLTGEVGLDAHQADVAARAEGMARRVGVAARFVNAVTLAGLVHDAGKAEPRFQAALYGSAGRPRGAVLLAKSGTPKRRWRQALEEAGLPREFRHEALSAALAASLGNDLVAHLAGASHGWGRPWFPPLSVDDPCEGASVRLAGTDRKASVVGNPLQQGIPEGVARRFEWLNGKIGPWSLAWLEATVRLADWAASSDPRSDVVPQHFEGLEAGTIDAPVTAPHSGVAPMATRLAGASTYTVRLTGIEATSAAGWLALLGTFGLCARRTDEEAVALSWDVDGPRPVPQLHCLWDGNALVAELLDVLLDVLRGDVPTWVVDEAWGQLVLPGETAVKLFAGVPVWPHEPAGSNGLPGLFCRPTKRGVALSDLLCGVTSAVRVRRVAARLADLVDAEDLRSTLFGPLRARVVRNGASFGLDWATVSDASRAGGEPAYLPARDLLALLGATWAPGAVRRHALAWAAWTARLAPADVSVLASRPELWEFAGEPARNHARRAELAALLRSWSITHVLASTTTKRSMSQSSSYYVWEEGQVTSLCERVGVASDAGGALAADIGGREQEERRVRWPHVAQRTVSGTAATDRSQLDTSPELRTVK